MQGHSREGGEGVRLNHPRQEVTKFFDTCIALALCIKRVKNTLLGLAAACPGIEEITLMSLLAQDSGMGSVLTVGMNQFFLHTACILRRL